MPKKYWALLDIQQVVIPHGFKLTLTTDVPCHLIMRWTLIVPQQHKIPVYRRGIALHTDKYFCFDTYTDNQQKEAGDTLIHTFIKKNWPICQTRYFYFHGTIDGEPSPSTTAIFKKHQVEAKKETMMPLFNSLEPQSFRPLISDTWADFDLSKIVPEGATGAVFHLINTDAGASRHVGLRMKGSTDFYGGSMKRNAHTWAMVGLDENLMCQGLSEVPASQHFLLVGYTGEYCTFFVNGTDIKPAAKIAWVDTDLSALCPGGIAAIIEFATHLDTQDFMGARKHGSTDDRHRGSYHMWMVVGLDANGHIDLWDQDWPVSADAFNLIGYITAGATFFTNADNISPVADGTWKTVSLGGYLANPVIAFIELDSGAGAEDYAIRKNAFTAEHYYDVDNHNFAIIHPNTPNATMQVKLENATIRLFLLGLG